MKAETYLAQNASKCQNQYKSMSLMHGKKSCATDPTNGVPVDGTTHAAKRLLGKGAHLLWMSIHVHAVVQ